MPINLSNANHRFTVALSFPGEHRTFVKQVADNLAEKFGRDGVLYDDYHDAEFARPDLDIYLPKLYRTESELIVLCLCPEYAQKRWCKLEWRHIRQLIATLESDRIFFLSFGNPGDLSELGILSGDGYIDIEYKKLNPQLVVERIFKRLDINRKSTHSSISNQDDMLTYSELYSHAEPIVKEVIQPKRNLSIIQTIEPSLVKQYQWHLISFSNSHDLGPALMGRGLGPSDAVACPQLIETNVIIKQLKCAFSARLVGDPGSGKSVCAYQVAYALTREGWTVVRLDDSNPNIDFLRLDSSVERNTLFLIDDAHLLRSSVLREIDDKTSPTKFLLTVHTMQDRTETHRGSIRIDPKRAVQTIATHLKMNLSNTLTAVKRADDRVGEGSFDEDLMRRIDAAESSSKFPWQFCFILGGGWRRANEATDASRIHGSDLIFAIAAALQLASRDAPSSKETVLRLGVFAGLTIENIENGLAWLVKERLLLSENDLRCPHQRFSSAIIGRIYSNLEVPERNSFIKVCREIVLGSTTTLAGVRILIHELRFTGFDLRWSYELWPHRWINEETLTALMVRCWNASTAEDKMFACLLISEIDGPWEHLIKDSEIMILGQWLSKATHPMGFGLSRLLNDIYNSNKTLAADIVAASNPIKIAFIASEITTENAYSVSEMINRIGLVCSNEWKSSFVTALQRNQIIEAIQNWPKNEYIWEFGNYCRSLYFYDREFGFSILKLAMPMLQLALAADPIKVFSQIEEQIAMSVLGVWDPLGIYRGKKAPDHKQKEFARMLCKQIDFKKSAEIISNVSRREFQAAAHFQAFFRKVNKKQAANLCRHLDWDRIDKTIGDNWKRLDHDSTIFICQASADSESLKNALSVIETHLNEIEILPSRLAILFPKLACSLVERGGKIAIEEDMSLNWKLATYVIHQFGELRPELIPNLLAPHESKAANSLQSKQTNIFDDADIFLRTLEEYAPEGLTRILSMLEPKAAEDAWSACFNKGGKPSRTAAMLVEHCLEMDCELGMAAKRLRKRYHKTSIPNLTINHVDTLFTVKP
jgi:hypothetical protein